MNEKLQKLEKKFWDARTALINEYKFMLAILIMSHIPHVISEERLPPILYIAIGAYAIVCLVQLFYYLWIKKQYVRELLSEDYKEKE